MKSLLFLRSGRQLHLHLRASLATPEPWHLFGATQLSKSESYVALETSLTPRQPSAPGRAVTENMKLNMAGSGDLIGGQQNPPSRLPGGVKLGGCYRAPCCSSAEQVMSAARDCQEMMHVLFYLDFSCTCPLGLIMNPYECIFFHLVSAGYGDL
jgi:hypothetical protein